MRLFVRRASLLLIVVFSEIANGIQLADDAKIVHDFLRKFDDEFTRIRQLEAEAAWNVSLKITEGNQERFKALELFKERWHSRWCEKLSYFTSVPYFLKKITNSQKRQIWLICRGPIYTPKLQKEFGNIQQELYKIYHTTVVCFERKSNRALICEHGEPELVQRMKHERNFDILTSIWQGWHDGVGGGPKGKRLYRDMVRIMNEAARNNGYEDMSECWKEQLGITNPQSEIQRLMREVFPLYEMLHGYVRHKLHSFYGSQKVSLTECIPAHILGNMWAQSWSSIMDIVAPEWQASADSLTKKLRTENANVTNIVQMADDFYISMGFEPMTPEFWKNSQFVKKEGQIETTSCHPSSLDMFNKGDFRMELCGEDDEETYFTTHHEMGHIQYFMSYQNQPAIFRDGANPAFHEAVGDSMIYAVQSPKHLKRLGLKETSEDSRIYRLFHQALDRIPLIAWSLVVDQWRWDVFSGKVQMDDYNTHFWNLRKKIQGVKPPLLRNEALHFDPLAKFHVPDNTPYMPYFFSSFLQVQMFEGMCNENEENLNQCDLFGSVKAGSKLRRMMKLGQSRPWTEAMRIITGHEKFSAKPLLQYYKPLIHWLQQKIKQDNITIGW